MRSPRLILPRDTRTHETDIVVLSLGDVALTSASGAGSSASLDQPRPSMWYDMIGLSIMGLRALLLRGSPLGRCYVWPRLKFCGESPWLLQPSTLQIEVAQCKSASQRRLPGLRAHVHVDALHLVLTTFKARLLVALAAAWADQAATTEQAVQSGVAELPEELPDAALPPSAAAVTIETPRPAPPAAAVVAAPSGPRRYTVVARVRVETLQLTFAVSSEATMRGAAPSSNTGNDASSETSALAWAGVDFGRACGMRCAPLLSLRASRLSVLCDINSDGLEVALSLGSVHAWDILRLQRAGWLAFAQVQDGQLRSLAWSDDRPAQHVDFVASDFGSDDAAPPFTLATRPASLPFTMDAPIHPLQWCQLIACEAAPSLGLSSAPDDFLTAHVLLYASPHLAPASTTADVSIGTVGVVLNRDLLAALIAAAGDVLAPSGSAAAGAQMGPPSSSAAPVPPAPAPAPGAPSPPAQLPVALSGPAIVALLRDPLAAQGHSLAGPAAMLVDRISADAAKRRAIQATVQLAAFSVVLNSEVHQWPGVRAAPAPAAPAAPDATLTQHVQAVTSIVSQISNFGFGACDLRLGRHPWRGYQYRGPLASFTAAGLVVAATIDAVATTVSLHLHSTTLTDLTTDMLAPEVPTRTPSSGSPVRATPKSSRRGASGPEAFRREHVEILAMELPLAGEAGAAGDASRGARARALALCALPAELLQAGAVSVGGDAFTAPVIAAAEAVTSQVRGVMRSGSSSSAEEPFDASLSLMAPSFFAWAWGLGTDPAGRVVVGCCGVDAMARRLVGGADAAALASARQYAAMLVDAVVLASPDAAALPGGIQVRNASWRGRRGALRCDCPHKWRIQAVAQDVKANMPALLLLRRRA